MESDLTNNGQERNRDDDGRTTTTVVIYLNLDGGEKEPNG